MNIGKKLKEQRVSLGKSALGMAKATGITNMTISNIENGKTVPRWDNIEKMCEYLGLHIILVDNEDTIVSE